MMKIIIHLINGSSFEVRGIYSCDAIINKLNTTRFVSLDTDEGNIYVNGSNVAYIEEVDDDE